MGGRKKEKNIESDTRTPLVQTYEVQTSLKRDAHWKQYFFHLFPHYSDESSDAFLPVLEAIMELDL